jgi:regulator of protease activity HflC (stomatin/prohibitin superfamily)
MRGPPGGYEEPGEFQSSFSIPDISEGCNPSELNPVVLGGSAACLVFVVAFAATSLSAVEPLHYGIRYNYFTKYADIDNVYGSGRYFIGPFSHFVKFPASVQSVEFSNEPRLPPSGVRYPALHTRTKEGLALHLQVALQYQLVQDQVGKLYAEFNREYEDMFISVIRDTLIRVAAEQEAWQLWENRAKVGERMQTMVDASLKPTYARCWGLQLMVIELPEKFENSIVATQVQKQTIETRHMEQDAISIQAQTKVIAAEYERQIKVIKAVGQANYSLQTRTARGYARKFVLYAEADMLAVIRERLALAAGDLVQYQQLSALTLMDNATVLFGFEASTPQVLVTSQSAVRPPQVSVPQPSQEL